MDQVDKGKKITMTFSRRVFELIYLRNSTPLLQQDLDDFTPHPNNRVEIQVTFISMMAEVLHKLLKQKTCRKEVHRIMAKYGLARIITDAEIKRLKRPGGGYGQFCKQLHDFTSDGDKYIFIHPHLEQGD